MKDVWDEPRSRHWLWGALGSALAHGALAAALFLMPAEARQRILGKVDFQVVKTAREPPEEKEPEKKPDPPEEAEEAEQERVAVAEKRPVKAKEPEPEEPVEPPPKPPPKFQMSGETFAEDGSWSLEAEVGDSRFGAVDGVGKYEPGENDEPKTEDAAPVETKPAVKTKPKFQPAKSSEVKSKPKVLLEQEIPYPAEARKLGIEGKVRLRVDIDEKGRVVKVVILQEPGGGLGQAAAKAMKKFQFAPAVGLNGKPVDYRITYTYVFELD